MGNGMMAGKGKGKKRHEGQPRIGIDKNAHAPLPRTEILGSL
jgi:hypothetical protein